MPTAIESLIQSYPQLYVQQRKEWTEILVNWETINKYAVLDDQKNQIAFIAERGGGISTHLKRWIFRSHRPMEIDIFDKLGQAVLHLSRPFFFFFSSLAVRTPEGELLGSVERRWGIIRKKYDLLDRNGQVFAKVSSPLWRLWTFPVEGVGGLGKATISKRWSGGLREIFTDADTYQIDFGTDDWTEDRKTIIFAAAISIDFDFFENNQGSSGLLDVLTPG